MQFAPKEKRIAVAPSFGREYVPEYNKKKISKYLMEIPHKSVREYSGVNIVASLTGDSADVLIDPTLVVSAEEWRESFNVEKKSNEDYLLAYFLDTPSENALRVIHEISKQYGLKIVGLPYQVDNISWDIKSAGPKEFVEYISGASFVCTDSFHGTVFSLNFNVPFFVFERNYGDASKQSTRIESILSYVGTEDRLDPQTTENCMEMDFKMINDRLFEKRKIAYEYLKRTINIQSDVEN